MITFIVGPTASGKSQLALDLALKNKGVIANADSVQVYKSLNIGAAKPTQSDQNLVPHHLYDLVEPSEVFTAGDYRRAGLKLIEALEATTPIYFVGGSGFYIQALEKGMFEVEPATEDVKLQLQQWSDAGRLYDELLKYDSVAAQKLSPQDEYRVRRALEVTLSMGRPFSEIEQEFKAHLKPLSESYQVEKIGLTIARDDLRKRVIMRTQEMLKAGLLDEVKSLVDRGFGDTKALQSVGYRECLAYFAGQHSRFELEEKIVTSTMQLAKKQMTWFKRDPDIRWI